MKQRRMSPRVKFKPEPVWEQISRRSISQNDLARLAKISSGYLSQLICGRKSPSPKSASGVGAQAIRRAIRLGVRRSAMITLIGKPY